MADYIYQLKPARPDMLTGAGPTPEENETIGRHFTYLSDLHKAGVVGLAGRTDTTHADTLGIVLLDAESEEAARQIMQNDPAVADGVMTAQLHPFRLAIGSLANTNTDKE